jgi:hypothetical protein
MFRRLYLVPALCNCTRHCFLPQQCTIINMACSMKKKKVIYILKKAGSTANHIKRATTYKGSVWKHFTPKIATALHQLYSTNSTSLHLESILFGYSVASLLNSKKPARFFSPHQPNYNLEAHRSPSFHTSLLCGYRLSSSTSTLSPPSAPTTTPPHPPLPASERLRVLLKEERGNLPRERFHDVA